MMKGWFYFIIVVRVHSHIQSSAIEQYVLRTLHMTFRYWLCRLHTICACALNLPVPVQNEKIQATNKNEEEKMEKATLFTFE